MALKSKLFAGDPLLEAAAVSDPAHIVPGARGPHVGKIQQALINLDGATISKVLRVRAVNQQAAVFAYKRKRNIINRSRQTSADNIVGTMTIASLDEEMSPERAGNPRPAQRSPSSADVSCRPFAGRSTALRFARAFSFGGGNTGRRQRSVGPRHRCVQDLPLPAERRRYDPLRPDGRRVGGDLPKPPGSVQQQGADRQPQHIPLRPVAAEQSRLVPEQSGRRPGGADPGSAFHAVRDVFAGRRDHHRRSGRRRAAAVRRRPRREDASQSRRATHQAHQGFAILLGRCKGSSRPRSRRNVQRTSGEHPRRGGRLINLGGEHETPEFEDYPGRSRSLAVSRQGPWRHRVQTSRR